MACGDKYKNLVVTTSGYTPENPGNTIPFIDAENYTEWYALTTKLSVEAHKRFLALGTIECQATGGTGCGTESVSGGSYPEWNALLELNNRMTARYDDLSDPSWTIDRTQARAEAQTVIADAVCLMESADAGIELYKGRIPVTPGALTERKPYDGIPWWIWVGGGIGLSIGAIALSRRWTRNTRERSAPPSGRSAAPREPTPRSEARAAARARGDDPDSFGARLAEDALASSRGGQ